MFAHDKQNMLLFNKLFIDICNCFFCDYHIYFMMVLFLFSLVLIKRGGVLEADKPVSQQLRFIDLTDGNPYETLHSYLSAAVSPFFKSFISESLCGDRLAV